MKDMHKHNHNAAKWARTTTQAQPRAAAQGKPQISQSSKHAHTSSLGAKKKQA